MTKSVVKLKRGRPTVYWRQDIFCGMQYIICEGPVTTARDRAAIVGKQAEDERRAELDSLWCQANE